MQLYIFFANEWSARMFNADSRGPFHLLKNSLLNCDYIELTTDVVSWSQNIGCYQVSWHFSFDYFSYMQNRVQQHWPDCAPLAKLTYRACYGRTIERCSQIFVRVKMHFWVHCRRIAMYYFLVLKNIHQEWICTIARVASGFKVITSYLWIATSWKMQQRHHNA